MQSKLTGLGDALNYCEHCGDMSAGHMTVTDSGAVCENCAPYFFTCDRCENSQHEDNYFGSTRSGKRICDGCASAHYCFCQSCEVVVLDDYYNFAANTCDRCASDLGQGCDGCGDWTRYEYGTENRRGYFMCEWCHEPEGLDGVRGYHDGAPWGLVFHHADGYRDTAQPGAIYFGCEIEMEGCGDTGDILATVEGNRDGHAESDSSLDEGLELITQPATLDAWRGQYGTRVAQYVARLNREGLSANSYNAGQHVHVSRTAFTDAKHLARFAAYFQHNRAHVVAVSGRGGESDNYASLSPFGRGDLAALAKRGRSQRGYGDRMRAVNMTNTATVEVRIWAGTDRAEETLGALEYVAALIEYTRDITVNHVVVGALLVDSFAAWLADSAQSTRYAHAVALIVARDSGRMAA